jgi:sugar (pentulose or hexulose) kinase
MAVLRSRWRQWLVEAFPATHPDSERHQLYSSAYHRYRDVYYVLKPVFEKVET